MPDYSELVTYSGVLLTRILIMMTILRYIISLYLCCSLISVHLWLVVDVDQERMCVMEIKL